MKHTLCHLGTLIVVGIFVLALFGSVAQAKPIVDKGDLGKYQRDGKFLRRVLASSSDEGSAEQKGAASTTRKVRYKKGERGTWVRDGRRMSKQSKSESQRGESRQGFHEPKYRVVDHIKHIHRFPA